MLNGMLYFCSKCSIVTCVPKSSHRSERPIWWKYIIEFLHQCYIVYFV